MNSVAPCCTGGGEAGQDSCSGPRRGARLSEKMTGKVQTPGGRDAPAARIRREKRTIEAMLRIFCRDHHGTADGVCSDCKELQRYAYQRLDSCPFAELKPACNHCEVHCYSRKMRDRVRNVMRYAGPRMLFRHPILSVGHLLDERRPVPTLRPRKKV